eukprot:COSAG01_NODE_2_length_63927_cov_1357.611941_56_plen_213_part_00
MLLSVQTFSDDLLSGAVSPTGSLRVSQTVTFNYDIEIQRISASLSLMNYSEAMKAIQGLMLKVRTAHSARIDTFFAVDRSSFFMVRQRHVDQDLSYSNEGYGLVYFKRFQNEAGHILDVNVVYKDPSILEYSHAIKRHRHSDDLSGIRVIKVNERYKCLESISDEHQFTERNIVINSDIMVNVFYDGSDSQRVLDQFLAHVQFEALERYLSL